MYCPILQDFRGKLQHCSWSIILSIYWCHVIFVFSFRMADMFPDCVGDVDVISDAENIKKLLKLPYSQGPVSISFVYNSKEY